MSDPKITFICPKCQKEQDQAFSVKVDGILHCSSCGLTIQHCDRCGTNTYTNYSRGADGKRYCLTCHTAINNEHHEEVMLRLLDSIAEVIDTLPDIPPPTPPGLTDPTPTYPSTKVTVTLPLIRFDLERCDAQIHEMRVRHAANVRERADAFWPALVMRVSDIVRQIRGLRPHCDGNHREPPCADPQCWCRKPQP